MRSAELPERSREGRWKLFLRKSPGVLIVAALCSCTAVYDVRLLEQPVILNDNPFLLSEGGPRFQIAVTTNKYVAEVSKSETSYPLENSDDDEESSRTEETNEAQVHAYGQIGGQTNRFIRKLSLDAQGGHVFWIFMVSSAAQVWAEGEVAEFYAADPAPLNAVQKVSSQSPKTSSTNAPAGSGVSRP
jgi:hypothetical protein